jgi:hypothetical protein
MEINAVPTVQRTAYSDKVMMECREKVSPAPAFLPLVNWAGQASAFRHQGQAVLEFLNNQWGLGTE